MPKTSISINLRKMTTLPSRLDLLSLLVVVFLAQLFVSTEVEANNDNNAQSQREDFISEGHLKIIIKENNLPPTDSPFRHEQNPGPVTAPPQEIHPSTSPSTSPTTSPTPSTSPTNSPSTSPSTFPSTFPSTSPSTSPTSSSSASVDAEIVRIAEGNPR